ncbi:MAG: Spy/CpxP family protein refolding chaperone [Proteobacteria bacterium]|nr:Spy/CpxP family protein refolding chaperone [Pseudomonadota bacterium]
MMKTSSKHGRMMTPRRWAMTAAIGVVLAAGMALAQPAGAPGAGPAAASGGWGPGMMGGHGGWGGGPGMMGGYGGWGGGPGMMGGYGRRGGGPRLGPALAQLDLSADQQQKIAAIREDTRRKNWDTMGALHTERYRLANLYRADPSDPNAIADELKKVDALRSTLVKAHVEADNQIRAVLTPEQRTKLRAYTSRWLDDDGD